MGLWEIIPISQEAEAPKAYRYSLRRNIDPGLSPGGEIHHDQEWKDVENVVVAVKWRCIPSGHESANPYGQNRRYQRKQPGHQK